jgi:hypothetical protein
MHFIYSSPKQFAEHVKQYSQEMEVLLGEKRQLGRKTTNIRPLKDRSMPSKEMLV